MRWLLVGVGALALAGCGRAPEASAPSSEMRHDGVAAAPAARAPGIDVTAAPGVAFSYRDGFRLPPDRIAAVQEAHAQACERLGVARCRITGMRYRLLGEHNIEGELAFKLAPALARSFTREAGTAVERAGGTLVDAEITGTDTLPMTEAAGTEQRRAGDEVARLDAQLARARTAAERAELQAQRADAARRVVAAQDSGSEARASLASTPVTFRYESGPAVRGFDTSAPFTSALNTGLASIQATLVVVLGIIAIFGPPALVAGLAIWAFLTIRRRLRRRGTPPVAPAVD